MWPAFSCVCLHVFFVYERRQKIPQAKGVRVSPVAHTCKHAYFVGCWYTAATFFLISSAARGSSGVSHHYESLTPPCLAYYTNATPLFLFSLLLLCLSLVSLINVRLANNKASILSLPASSVPRICHCALTLPLHQLSSHHHRFTWPQNCNAGPQCQHESLFRGSIRNWKKGGGGISLTSIFSSSGPGKKGSP